MAGVKEKIRYLGMAVRGAVSPWSWADELMKEREDRAEALRKEAVRKQLEPLERKNLARNPRLRKSYLGNAK